MIPIVEELAVQVVAAAILRATLTFVPVYCQRLGSDGDTATPGIAPPQQKR